MTTADVPGLLNTGKCSFSQTPHHFPVLRTKESFFENFLSSSQAVPPLQYSKPQISSLSLSQVQKQAGELYVPLYFVLLLLLLPGLQGVHQEGLHTLFICWSLGKSNLSVSLIPTLTPTIREISISSTFTETLKLPSEDSTLPSL